MEQPHVLIIGGGFGGLSAARALAREPVRVTLIDSSNHHLFQPLLYQVATGALSPAEIARPIRRILRKQSNVGVMLHQVQAIDPVKRQVRFKDGSLSYDYLILAAGARHAYFGHDEWEKIAPGLKSLQDALEIRRRILLAFENADREPDAGAKQAWLTFVIVGGGPTGVELAGAIAEIARHQVAPDFRGIDPAAIGVILVEAAPRVLTSFPPELSAAASDSLRALGAEIITGAVTALEPGRVMVGDRELRAGTVLWAAGVAASPLAKSLGVPLDRAGRVLVNRDLTVPGYPNILAIGDIAGFLDELGKPLPGVAPVAMQQGPHAARNISRALRGAPLEEFRYRDKGNLATIGRASAVADFGRFRLSGFPAWIAWLMIHIFFLIGFRNRFVAMFTWAWMYFTYERAAMLIVGED
jgi:NADH dehydrogenase